MLDHPKWRRALRLGGDEVVATWVRLVSWCSRNLTDGRVPADVVAQVSEVRSVERSRALRALADAGLIAFSHPSDAGLTAVSSGSDVIVTDYLERNPSRSQVLEERARRSQSQRARRVRSPEARASTGHASTSDPRCNEVPARPGPARPIPEDQSAARSGRAPASAPLVARTVSLPSERPTQEYLDAAAMAGVSPEQATSTWEHYFGAGLPDRGVEKLTPWMVKRAKERATSTARLPRAGPEDRLQKQADRVRMLREQEAEDERRAAAGGVSS